MATEADLTLLLETKFEKGKRIIIEKTLPMIVKQNHLGTPPENFMKFGQDLGPAKIYIMYLL